MDGFRALMRARREALSKTQVDLAADAGVPQSTISRIERGAYKEVPPPELLNPLARALDLPVATVLAEMGYALDGPPIAPVVVVDPEREALLAKLRRVRLTPERERGLRRALENMLEFDAGEPVEQALAQGHKLG